MLYYGDIFGKIIALKVADFVTPDPSSVPTTTHIEHGKAGHQYDADD